MTIGKRRRRPKPPSVWVATQDRPPGAHPFCARLNQILDNADFDGHVEGFCQRFYPDEIGRPGLERRVLARTSLVMGDETLFLERARSVAVYVARTTRVASSLVPIRRDPAVARRLNELHSGR